MLDRIAIVNRAIRKLDPTAELIKSDGYFYFDGDSVGGMSPRDRSNSVMVYRLNDLTLDEWVKCFRDFQEQELKQKTFEQIV